VYSLLVLCAIGLNWIPSFYVLYFLDGLNWMLVFSDYSVFIYESFYLLLNFEFDINLNVSLNLLNF
jgi:hypothetical protein